MNSMTMVDSFRIRKTISDGDLKLTIALADSSRREIVELLNKNAQGMTAKEIADELRLTIPTIMSHLRNLQESKAVTCRRRTGKQTKRILKRYYSLVQFESVEKIAASFDTAKENFSCCLQEALLRFFMEHEALIPPTKDPFFLAEWLEQLMRETHSEVSTSFIFSPNAYLIAEKPYREVAINAAKAMLFNDFMFLLNDYACNLFLTNPQKIREIGKHFGQRSIKSEYEIMFVIEAMYALLFDSSEKAARGYRALMELIDALPKQLSPRLRTYLSSVLECRNMPEKIKEKVGTFFFFSDEDELLRRCKRNAFFITRFGGKDHAKRGPKM
jgi:DNA-binding transcriptional ArsR family regulator